MPVYMGGEKTISSYLSLDTPITHPKDNYISFLTGEDDKDLTRTMGLWLSNPDIKVAGIDY